MLPLQDYSLAGITPACAGKSILGKDRCLQRQDHPRVCGEKAFFAIAFSCLAGSPPRVRGKVITYQLTPERSGITPACAGKRNSQHTTFTSERDHPRVCGEKGGPHRAGHPPRGSPPRVRGKAEWENLIGSDVRITPACAGKRKSHSKHKKHHRDHPRVCGEKTMKEVREVWQLGSPPRMRGKGKNAYRPERATGITPAYAGKSCGLGIKSRFRGDHPRVCGEKLLPLTFYLPEPGSPPRMRGKEGSAEIARTLAGITPAYAGKRKGGEVNGTD